MVNRLSKWAEARGHEIAWGPVAVLGDTNKRRGTGELDASFDREHLRCFGTQWACRSLTLYNENAENAGSWAEFALPGRATGWSGGSGMTLYSWGPIEG